MGDGVLCVEIAGAGKEGRCLDVWGMLMLKTYLAVGVSAGVVEGAHGT